MLHFYAHRGNNDHTFEENTVNALLNSLDKEYIDGIEMDIRYTFDKKLVIYHEPNIYVNNSSYFISNLSLKELEKNTKIDELSTFLRKVKTNKKLIIEVKYENKLDIKDIDILYKELNKYNNLNIYLCSFNYKFIKTFKKKYSNYKCGLLIGNYINYFHIFSNLDFYSIRYNLKRIYTKKQLYFWTVNSKEQLKNIKIKNKNINVITDNAYLLKS